MRLMSLISICLGFFMVIMDATIVNTALPAISHHLQGNFAQLQWIIAAYTLTFASFLLSSGSLADRIGARPAYLWGVALFVIASLACGLSSSLALLILFRLIQGISAAFLVPTSLALINLSYPDKTARDKAIGIWGAIGGIAAALGPFLGGLLTAWIGWRAIFFVNIPIGLLSFILTLYFVTTHKPLSHPKHFDFSGQLFGILSIGSLTFGLIEAGKAGFLTSPVMISAVIFGLAFTGFLVIESRSSFPMFPLSFFRSSKFSAAIVIGMILNASLYGELFILPFYFQHVRGYSTFITGLALLPLVSFIAIASYLAGKISAKKGVVFPMVTGLFLGALGFFLLLIVKSHTPSYWLLILPLAMVGFGTALTMPAATITAVNSVPPHQSGIAAGALNASRQTGSLMGVAIFGSILNASKNFISGMHITLIIAGILFLAGTFLTLRFIGKKDSNIC